MPKQNGAPTPESTPFIPAALPDGWELATSKPTKAGTIVYTVEYMRPTSLAALLAEVGEDAVLRRWIAAQAQDAKQGGKQPVRDAGSDPEKIAAAIQTHQETARNFITGTGASRTSHPTGLTLKQQEALGARVALAAMRGESIDMNALIDEIRRG